MKHCIPTEVTPKLKFHLNTSFKYIEYGKKQLLLTVVTLILTYVR